MADQAFKIRVRLNNGQSKVITFIAEAYFTAKAMAEAQYGKENVMGPG